MKNKILSIFMLGLLVFTSLNVIAFEEDYTTITICEKKESIMLSDLSIETKQEYIVLDFFEANAYVDTPGKPMLPVYVKTYKFPIGTKIYDVEFIYSDIETEILSGKIKPAPKPVPLISLDSSSQIYTEEKTIVDFATYSSADIYPDKSFEYSLGVGIDGNQRVIFLTVRIYPVRYAPAENTIYYIQESSVKITYEPGSLVSPSESEYDMVIITPRKFVLEVYPLKMHKNKKGVSTKIVTTESIYFKYKGRDRQEDIKLFIKDAIEKWNITYVLLVGGRKGLGLRWAVPARTSGLEDRSGWNETYVSDLYYSDVYKYNTTSQDLEFDDWDSNGNGVFAEWKWTWNESYWYWTYPVTSKDVMDLYPDVYLGRLACRSSSEVRTVVRKIIRYEKNAYSKPWFNNMIVAGGDTVPYFDGVMEGEYENNYSAVIMEGLGFNVTRLWVSNGNLNSSKDVINTVGKGAGFLFFAGHGSPIVWSTHPQDNESWIDGLWNDEMNNIRNRDKLPICVVGGCHNSQFDVALINMIKGILELGSDFFKWIDDENVFGKLAFLRRCWSWNLVRQRNGGSIAAIGNTGLGWGVGGEGCIEGQDGFITSRFFEVYRNCVLADRQNVSLGLVHTGTINLYIDTFDPNSDELDRKTIEEWVLLGDPSLKIGGYS